MKICLVLMASLVVVASGHKTDGGSYSAKKASLKESLVEKLHNFKDKINAKIATKKEKIHAKKAAKYGDLTGNVDKGAQPAADCSTVMDEVWEEQCGTKYEPVCRMEMQPHCTSIQARECAPESKTSCSFVFEDKCKTISVPKCTIDWEKRCTSTPDCTTTEEKSCTEVEKDVCVTHMDKICTMSTVNVCRKVAIREFTPEDDAVERVGLKASFKAKAAAHKAHKAQIKAEKLASKGDRAYTPVVDTVKRVGLKASIKAKAAAHKALKKEKIAEKLAAKAHGIFKRSSENEPGNEPVIEPENEPENEPGNEGDHADELALKGLKAHRQKRQTYPGFKDPDSGKGPSSLPPSASGFINPETGGDCPNPYFSCDDNLCFSMDKYCDGKIDCIDRSDEVNHKCNIDVPKRNESVSEDEDDDDSFDSSWYDDYVVGEAEEDKEFAALPESEKWTCDDGQQIRKEHKCDLKNHCLDHSDELVKTCIKEPLEDAEKDHLKKEAEAKLFLTNEECRQAVRNGFDCKVTKALVFELMGKKDLLQDALATREENLTPELRFQLTSHAWRKELERRRDICKVTVRGGHECTHDDMSQLFQARFEVEAIEKELIHNLKAYSFAQEVSSDPTDPDLPKLMVLLEKLENKAVLHRTRRGADDQLKAHEEALSRISRSLKGDVSGEKIDFKGRLETFKAGLKAAKAQYHEAKAQFKATTKALVHAKFNKGQKASKGDKGLKTSVPTIRVRYEKSCQDEPRKICTQTPRQECHKEVVPLCKTEPRETCVPKEKCKSWPKKSCAMVSKETCFPFPTKKCTEISTPVCRVVPRQECTEKKHEICETVPTKDCQKVLVSKPRTVCIPRPTSRTIEDW